MDDKELLELKTSVLLEKFGAGEHKPGSGSAAALLGILAAELLRTVICLTKDPKRSRHYEQNLADLLKIESDIDNQLIPELRQLFRDDSIEFDNAIHLRRARDDEKDLLQQRKLDKAAVVALIPATEIPIRIAKISSKIASYALQVFDYGFKYARGDSSVALNAAISAMSGCISIVELNLTYFEASDWTASIQSDCKFLVVERDSLEKQAQERLAEQFLQTERKMQLSVELQGIAIDMKGGRSLSESDIEQLARRLQLIIWSNRDLIWKNNIPNKPLEILKPDIVLKMCFGYCIEYSAALGHYVHDGVPMEIAAQIDQQEKLVSVSDKLQMNVRNFTTAHELGHHLLHTQNVLHRDRPLDGTRSHGVRSGDEWQADKFATFFLMPRKQIEKIFAVNFLTNRFRITEETALALNVGTSQVLRDRCKNLQGLARLLADTTFYNGRSILSLSERFGVSTKAMAIRLEELNLVEY